MSYHDYFISCFSYKHVTVYRMYALCNRVHQQGYNIILQWCLFIVQLRQVYIILNKFQTESATSLTLAK